MKNTAIGALVGIVLSAAIIILRFLMDSVIRDEQYLLDTYKDIPILSVIPDLTAEEGGGYYYAYRNAAKKNGAANKGAKK